MRCVTVWSNKFYFTCYWLGSYGVIFNISTGLTFRLCVKADDCTRGYDMNKILNCHSLMHVAKYFWFFNALMLLNSFGLQYTQLNVNSAVSMTGYLLYYLFIIYYFMLSSALVSEWVEFVKLGLHKKNYLTDFHKIRWKGGTWRRKKTLDYSWKSGSRYTTLREGQLGCC